MFKNSYLRRIVLILVTVISVANLSGCIVIPARGYFHPVEFHPVEFHHMGR